MKKLLIFAMFLAPMFANAQEDGIGLRFGEPLSITYKKFLDDNFAIEGMFGRAGINNNQYYQRSFDNNRPSPNAFYASHSTGSSFAFNLRAAYHEDITDDLNIEVGYFLAYAGVGVQLRSTRVDYAYTEGSAGILLRDSRRNIDFGPEIFGGGEYYFDDLPISVFAEIGMFVEFLDRFGHLKLQGGLGVRYLF